MSQIAGEYSAILSPYLLICKRNLIILCSQNCNVCGVGVYLLKIINYKVIFLMVKDVNMGDIALDFSVSLIQQTCQGLLSLPTVLRTRGDYD